MLANFFPLALKVITMVGHVVVVGDNLSMLE